MSIYENSTSNKTARSTQYQRTDKAIVHAFYDLLAHKSYEAITVQDILDATPISRAGFYRHFLDKEAIAEQMLEEFYQVQRSIVGKMKVAPDSQYVSIVSAALRDHQETIQALLKIRTEKVNIRDSMAKTLVEKYPGNSSREASQDIYLDIKQQVYAQALTAFQFATMQRAGHDHALSEQMGDPAIFNEVMIDVFLTIMNWRSDTTLRSWLLQKTSKR